MKHVKKKSKLTLYLNSALTAETKFSGCSHIRIRSSPVKYVILTGLRSISKQEKHAKNE